VEPGAGYSEDGGTEWKYRESFYSRGPEGPEWELIHSKEWEGVSGIVAE
jgi:hypothetical protein